MYPDFFRQKAKRRKYCTLWAEVHCIFLCIVLLFAVRSQAVSGKYTKYFDGKFLGCRDFHIYSLWNPIDCGMCGGTCFIFAAVCKEGALHCRSV